MVRRVAVRVVAAALFLAVVPGASAARTRVIHWSPFGELGDLRAGLVATPRYGGDCPGGSFFVHHAYRCFAGHYIYDPCWLDETSERAIVVCPGDPWSRNVIRLRISGHLSDAYSGRPGTVWAIRMASGQHCVFVGGATNVVGGRRLNYICRHGYLFGSPDRHRPTWRIRFSRTPDGVGIHKRAIAQAYIGTT